MNTVSRFVLRHRLLVTLFWLAVFVAGMVNAGRAVDALEPDFSYPGRAGYETNLEILRGYGNGGPGHPVVPVITLPEGSTVDTPGVAAALTTAYGGLAKDGLRAVSYPADRRFATADGRTVFGLVFTKFHGQRGGVPPAEARQMADRLGAALPAGSQVRVTGLDQLTAEYEQTASTDNSLLVETMIGAIGALLVLAVVFGSFLAFVPILVAAVAIMASFLAVLGMTELTTVNFITQYVLTLVGLGVAIDYSLLLVTRWREERAHGHDKVEATRRAMARAGRSIVFSGAAVAVGMLVLLALPVPFIRSLGLASLLIPVLSVAVCLTLLPVLLSTVGAGVDWPRRRLRKEGTVSRTWVRWATWVTRRPWAATLIAALILVPLCGFALAMRTGDAPSSARAQSGPARDTLTALAGAGVPTGIVTPIEVLVPPGGDTAGTVAKLSTVEGVYLAADPGWRGRDGSALVTVLPREETMTGVGRAVVERVRDAVPAGVKVGGSGAQLIDSTAALYGLFPVLLVIILVVTFVLLTRAFRSAVLAGQAVVLNLVSIGAAYGAITAIWQFGWGSKLLWDIPALGSVTSWVPLMTFAFLFGLSMDYQVFLLSRIREEYDATGSPRAAVVAGLGRVGRLVTSAALILFLAFVSMAGLPAIDLKVMATGLGAAILIDATVLRMLLVPALVTLTARFWAKRPPAAPTANRDMAAPGSVTGAARPR